MNHLYFHLFGYRKVKERFESLLRILHEVLGAGASSIVRWHPSTDYLGNHRLSSSKIREKLGWKPALDLKQGIRETYDWIRVAEGYNPLKYLDEAGDRKINLLEHFPAVK